MNNRYRFRAWDKRKNVMLTNFYIWSVTGVVESYSVDGVNRIDGKNLVLMQYTGLKDKNGVEIYEGDIVRFKNQNPLSFTDYPEIGVVCWYREYAKFSIKYNDRFNKRIETYSPLRALDKEVIGNIFQDSHLLEDKK